MTYYYLYKITNIINGKIYIGVHRTKNINDGYMGSGKYLKNAINKYGIENFTKEILKRFESEEEMFNEEAELVDEEFVKRKDTYNIKNGGNGGGKYATEKLKEKYGKDGWNIICKKGRDAQKEKYGDDGAKILSKNGHDVLKEKYPEGTGKGKKHTEEAKKKIGQVNSIKQKGEKNSQYGTCGIHNIELKQNKKIKKDDLQEGIDNGGVKGRKMKFF